MPRKQKRMSQKDWDERGERMRRRWANRWGDPEMWERRAHRGKIGFAVFLLLAGIMWMLRDMGYITNLPLVPALLILFAVFLLISRM